MNLPRELLDALRGLSAFVWPGPCFVCGDDLPARAVAGACPRCWSSLPARQGPGCPRCDLPGVGDAGACPDCRGAHDALDGTVAALVYEGAVRALHRRLKFGGAHELAAPLAARMTASWERRRPGAVDLVVRVPPDPLRWTARRRVPGLLAAAVAKRLTLEFAPAALRKTRPTRALTGRGAHARRRALAGSFRARPDLVAGRRVLVVDDVATTGATLAEAARALDEAGARAVFALVLARTPLTAG